MNLRLFSIALLISALPAGVYADPSIHLNKGDFIAAEKVSKDGETVLAVKLSKSGKAKLRKVKKQRAQKVVLSDIAGVASTFTLREPIKGDGLEIGPYSSEDAQKVASEINKKN